MKKSLKYILVLILALGLSLGVRTFAKYIVEEFHSYYLNAKHFYFTSNRLKKNNPTYLINNWSGVGSFQISFDILSEKNRYVYTDYDIPYTVRFVCPNDVECSVDKPTGTVMNASTGHKDTITLSVNPTRSYSENERLSIYIESTSVSPYQETIGATFEYVVGKQGVTYEIDDEASRVYMIFKITNAINFCTVRTAFGNYAVGDLIDVSTYRALNATDRANCVGKNIELTFNPNVVILDTTDNIMKRATYHQRDINGTLFVDQLNFQIEPVSTTAIKFYKANKNLNYTYPIVTSQSIIGVSITD